MLTTWWPDRSHDVAATVPKTGLKEMETNWPWSWILIVLITINMILAIITDHWWPFQDDCQSWPCCFSMTPPPSAYESSCPTGCSWEKWGGNWPLDRSLPSPLVADIQKKANFPFHQPCLFNIFWAASSQTPLLVTIRVDLMWRWMAGREGGHGGLKHRWPEDHC